MAIITLQRRLRQAGRIRIGAKVATKTGGSRPSKLESFRFTSPDQAAIEAVAEAFGGDIQPWDGAAVGTQWEVYTKATEFPIIVPPTDIAFSQFFELWSGGGCQRRCDGVTNILTDAPCLCDPENQECRPTTRLNVILSDIDGIGVFRLESHGYNSAAELSGSIEVLKQIQARNGAMVPGRLMLEQRQSKRIDPVTNKAETYNFAVPVLDFNINIAAMGRGESRQAIGVSPIRPEVPELPSVAEQVRAASVPVERPKRSNAATPLPSTGLKPRGISTVIPPTETDVPSVPDVPKAVLAKTPASDKTPGGASKASVRRLFAILNGRDDIGKDDDARHMWALTALGWGTDAPISFNDLTQKDITKLNDAASETAQIVEEKQMQYADDDSTRPF